MLGELWDIIKLMIEIYKGNVPPAQLYTVIIVILAVAIVDSLIEIIKNRGAKSRFKFILEAIASSFIGFTLYVGFYLFVFRIPAYYLDNPDIFTDSVSVWIAIISYISFVSLFSMFYLYKQTASLIVKGLIIVAHMMLTVLIMLAMNQIWIPQIEMPISILLLTTLFNTVISTFFIVFGTTHAEAKSDQVNSIAPN